MTKKELINKLNELRKLQTETELVEFKEARNGIDFNRLGKYFSALSNEANLHRSECAWLIFGVENKQHLITGTDYRMKQADLNSLKKEIADKTSNRISFIEIHELSLPEGRVLMFQIPPAPDGMPVAFEGHYYGRDSESLVPLNPTEYERIRSQRVTSDWTAAIVEDACLDDLDKQALQKARVEFVKRNPKYKQEEPTWNDAKFLDKAKITIRGKITRTALILLGKEESEHLLGSFVKIRWNLKTVDNQDKDYEIFSIPLLLAVDEVYKKIRNLKYRYLPDGTLFPEEFLRYDPFTIREPLNNAIAHQDFSKGGRVNVVEFEDDHLVYSNCGTFLPRSVEDVVLKDVPEEVYRNPFLVEAMKNLDMIETQGGGIRKMFNFQRKRFFPMPDFDFSDEKVRVTIPGKILNEDFARILINNPELSLEDILLLDKVQKKLPITDEAFQYLKKRKWIEGRKPNPYLSSDVLKPVDNDELKVSYMANKSFDDDYFKTMITGYLKKFGPVKRNTIDNLIIPKLSAVLTEQQKKNKVTNYLSALRREGVIVSKPGYYWELV
ncbi:MAG: putative DNA binding domain-containing protein [Paludibacter sp.]|nr:putative DNA binding domain-containing protein [Paludibacter sp.]MDD4198517.1 putative DNA binding domain-containing protein [Paludibacter sp.]MDD4428001.1 putative DNA binding domain-containing protein [Paludibacter sp.]